MAQRQRQLRSPMYVLLAILLLGTLVSAESEGLRIVAFGDSITEGWTKDRDVFHPYSKKLQELVHTKFPKAVVVSEGVTGELVVTSMAERLLSAFKLARATGNTIDWVLLQGGINDIGWGRDADTIWSTLFPMYMAVRFHNAKLVAMTLPEYADPGLSGSPNDAKRVALNAHIRKFAEQHKDGSVFLLDLEKLLPGSSLAEVQRKAMWADAVHPTPAGYDKMAELLWEHVLKDNLQAPAA